MEDVKTTDLRRPVWEHFVNPSDRLDGKDPLALRVEKVLQGALDLQRHVESSNYSDKDRLFHKLKKALQKPPSGVSRKLLKKWNELGPLTPELIL